MKVKSLSALGVAILSVVSACGLHATVPVSLSNLQRVNGTNQFQSATGQTVTPTPIQQQLPTVAALKAFTVAAADNGMVIQTAGYFSAGDGGGNVFAYNSGSAVADNGGSIIAPTGGSGRWIAVVTNSCNVLQFGAKGSGSSSDAAANTAAFIAAATWLSSKGGGTMVVPPASSSFYLAPSLFSSLSHITIYGYGAAVASGGPLSVTISAPLQFTSCTDIKILGLEVDGRMPFWNTQPQTNVNNHCIDLVTCARVEVTGCYIHDSGCNSSEGDYAGDGIYCPGSSEIFIHNNWFLDCARWSCTAVGACQNINCSDNVVWYLSTAPLSEGFLDFELGDSSGNNLTVARNQVLGSTSCNINANAGHLVTGAQIIDNQLSAYSIDNHPIGNATSIAMLYVTDGLIKGNIVYGFVQAITVTNCTNIRVESNVADGSVKGTATLYGAQALYSASSTNVHIGNNTFICNSATGNGIQIAAVTGIVLIGNYSANSPNIALTMDGTTSGAVVIGNSFIGVAGEAFAVGCTAGSVFVGNYSNNTGRFAANPDTIIGNAAGINTAAATWWNGAGRYVAPETATTRNFLWLSAAPGAGTWSVGDTVFNNTPSSGQPKGWVCTVAGSPGTWVSLGNL